MYFCPKCNFIFDIRKNLGNVNLNKIEINDFINLVIESNSNNIMKLNFTKNDLKKNAIFISKSNNEKELILKKYDELNYVENKFAHFICNNCSFVKKLEKGTTILKKKSDSSKIINSLESIINNNTLPRTKDFICPKTDCSSHDKKNAKTREAIFYRPQQSQYYINYICTSCNTIWKP